jgi:hypothetical protein
LGGAIGFGREAETYEYGANLIKLYRQTAAQELPLREAANMSLARSLGLPAPQVLGVEKVEGRWGIVMTRTDAPSFAQQIGNRSEIWPPYLEAMARLHLHVHSHVMPISPI